MAARFPIDSNRGLTADVTFKVALPGNQHANTKTVNPVLKTGTPEDVVVYNYAERLCELQSYFRSDRCQIGRPKQTDSALAEIIACREKRI